MSRSARLLCTLVSPLDRYHTSPACSWTNLHWCSNQRVRGFPATVCASTSVSPCRQRQRAQEPRQTPRDMDQAFKLQVIPSRLGSLAPRQLHGRIPAVLLAAEKVSRDLSCGPDPRGDPRLQDAAPQRAQPCAISCLLLGVSQQLFSPSMPGPICHLGENRYRPACRAGPREKASTSMSESSMVSSLQTKDVWSA